MRQKWPNLRKLGRDDDVANWIELTVDRHHWRALVKAVLNLWIL